MAGSELFLGKLVSGMKDSLAYSADKNAESASRLADLVAIEGASLPAGTTLMATDDYISGKIVLDSNFTATKTANTLVSTSERGGSQSEYKTSLSLIPSTSVITATPAFGGNFNLGLFSDPFDIVTECYDDIALSGWASFNAISRQSTPQFKFRITRGSNVGNVVIDCGLPIFEGVYDSGRRDWRHASKVTVSVPDKIVKEIVSAGVSEQIVVSNFEYLTGFPVNSKVIQDTLRCDLYFSQANFRGAVGYGFNSPLVDGAVDIS